MGGERGEEGRGWGRGEEEEEEDPPGHEVEKGQNFPTQDGFYLWPFNLKHHHCLLKILSVDNL